MTDLELVKELVSEVCRCGGWKQAHKSFCFKCYGALPPLMQRDLYKRLGKGYREGYEAAAVFLEADRSLG